MPQQQTFALPLRDFGQGEADGGALLLADQEARRAGEVVFEWLVVAAVEPADAFESSAGAFGGAQPVEREVESDPPQPGADLWIGSILELGFGRQLQKRFLKRVLGLHAVAQRAVHQTEELGVK